MFALNRSSYSIGVQWIHTNCSAPLENHCVNVVDGVVDSFTEKPTQRPSFFLGDACQIIPCPLNAHTHLELTGIAEPIDVPAANGRRSMPDWITQLMMFRRSERYNALHGIAEAFLRQDVLSQSAAVADIVPANINVQKIAAPQVPIWFPYRELIAWSPEQVKERLTSSVLQAPFISPHAPQTVCPELLHSVMAMNVPVAMHLAESLEEMELLQTGGGTLLDLMRRADADYEPKNVLLGKRPMDYLQLLAQAPQALIVHGNYLDDDELRFIAQRRDTMSVVYCPRSHHYFGYKKYPLKKMLDLGVRVLLGTDSLASSPDLNVANEMRWVMDEYPELALSTVIQMGTLDSVAALGLSERLGTIQVGCSAQFGFL